MIDAANQAGGLDNITAMIADFREPAGNSSVRNA